jgi:hypothetical protein
LALEIAVSVVLVSLVKIRTEKSMESVVTCSSERRFAVAMIGRKRLTSCEGGENPNRGSAMWNPVTAVSSRNKNRPIRIRTVMTHFFYTPFNPLEFP